ncbi:MAG: RNA polymerase sigma factor [Massiliimalia sp.]
MDFSQIYESYFKDVYRYLLGLSGNEAIAEEIAQEAFTKALKSLNQFDGSSEIKAWLFTIAKNTYFTHCKKQKHNFPVPLSEQEDTAQTSFSDQLADEETAFQIHQFLHTMQDPYKEVFHLRVFGELPFEQIGRIFGKNPSWARVTFYRAKQQIINYMEEIEHGKNKL